MLKKRKKKVCATTMTYDLSDCCSLSYWAETELLINRPDTKTGTNLWIDPPILLCFTHLVSQSLFMRLFV